jgi:membrane fusion protein (multidrug efflux system)
MKIRTKTWLATGLALLLVLGLLGGVKAAQIATMINAGKSFSIPPESVTSAVVEESRWETIRDGIGTLVAARGVTLAAELPGKVREIGFESGTPVRKGTVLVRLDTSTEEAQLASAEAEASLARIGLERAQALRRGEASSPAELDAAEAHAKQAQAAVDVLRAAIDKKNVRAPFDGRIAIRQVELGQVLQPGSPIASLQSVSPVHAEFWLPQQALAEVRVGQKARIRTDAFPGATWEGQVSTVNTEVDVATRNVRFRATFANPDGRLRPGMFANVEVVGAEKRPVLAIPATAVIFAPYGDSVYVLEERKDGAGKATTVARQAFVRLGERRGDFVAVVSGLRAGDTVVSSGAFKLRNGAAVAVQNALAPEAQLAPRPVDP